MNAYFVRAQIPYFRRVSVGEATRPLCGAPEGDPRRLAACGGAEGTCASPPLAMVAVVRRSIWRIVRLRGRGRRPGPSADSPDGDWRREPP